MYYIYKEVIMKLCNNCGLGIKENSGLVSCFKYKTVNNPQEDKEGCIYYIEAKCEGGEPLSPLQHLLLKEENLRARKMKGVI